MSSSIFCQLACFYEILQENRHAKLHASTCLGETLYLDTSRKNLLACALLNEGWSLTMDGSTVFLTCSKRQSLGVKDGKTGLSQ